MYALYTSPPLTPSNVKSYFSSLSLVGICVEWNGHRLQLVSCKTMASVGPMNPVASTTLE